MPTKPADAKDQQPFSITSPTYKGLVAVRFNYPYQAVALSQATEDRTPISSDATVTEQNSPPGNATVANQGDAGARPYSGPHGLGRQMAFPGVNGGQGIRPFRRLLPAQAIHRREVFR